jgi:hypothetical protein
VRQHYESTEAVESRAWPGVRLTLRRMSFTRRVELMRRIRELAGRMEFADAGPRAEDRMEAGMLQAEIDRIYLEWGLAGVSGLEIDGEPATADLLIDRGPEELVREALGALKASAGLSDAERKN